LNRIRLVVPRHPCSHSIECWHGGGSGKKKKQWKGKSSSSVIAVDRRRGVLHVFLPIPAPHRRIILPRRRVHGALRVISGIRNPESRGCGAATGLVAHGLISCWIVPQKTSHHRRPHLRCPEDRSSSPPPAAHPRCRWARALRCRRGTWGDFLLLWRRMFLRSS
ncbi:hypothetical protein TcCL_ESM11189, partial [Trypanosoma cruzi]